MRQLCGMSAYLPILAEARPAPPAPAEPFMLLGASGATYQILDVEIVAGEVRGVAEGVRTGCLVSFHQASHVADEHGMLACRIVTSFDLGSSEAAEGCGGAFPAALARIAVPRVA